MVLLYLLLYWFVTFYFRLCFQSVSPSSRFVLCKYSCASLSAVNLVRPLMAKCNTYLQSLLLLFVSISKYCISDLTGTGFISVWLLFDYSPNLIITLFNVCHFKQVRQWQKIWAVHMLTVKQIICSVKHPISFFYLEVSQQWRTK